MMTEARVDGGTSTGTIVTQAKTDATLGLSALDEGHAASIGGKAYAQEAKGAINAGDDGMTSVVNTSVVNTNAFP